jgi:hypothetical protein
LVGSLGLDSGGLPELIEDWRQNRLQVGRGRDAQRRLLARSWLPNAQKSSRTDGQNSQHRLSQRDSFFGDSQ